MGTQQRKLLADLEMGSGEPWEGLAEVMLEMSWWAGLSQVRMRGEVFCLEMQVVCWGSVEWQGSWHGTR